MHGNIHAVFAVVSWRRGFHVKNCHRQWNMVAPLWTCKQCQSVEWKHGSLSRTKKFRSVPSVCEVMLTLGPYLSTLMIVDRWSLVDGIVLCLKRSGNMLFTVDAEECWQMELFCIMTLLELMWHHHLLKWFQNWNLSFSSTQCTVQIMPHLITIFLDCRKMGYMDADLQMMKRSRTWHIHGFVHDQKHFSRVLSGSLWTEISVWRS